MQELHRVPNMPQYGWIEREYAWIYDNRKGSEYVSYNI